jgi:predicted nucleic acid-binding protein
VKVFLDACCLSRLTDDQSQARIREEAEAIERILAGVRLGTVELISSEALEDEARRTPSIERRLELETLLSLASNTVEVGDAIAQRSQELASAGYGPFDALHLAAAESAGVDVLLSTDDRLIKRVARGMGNPRIAVRNPVSWSKEQGL